MKWEESHQPLEQQKEAGAMFAIDAFSPERAAKYAEKMLRHECKGWGDETNALASIGRKCGLSAKSLKRLIKGERKTVDTGLYVRIRMAYLSFCSSLIESVKTEMNEDIEEHGHAAFADIFDDLAALEAKVEAAKAGARAQAELVRSRRKSPHDRR